MQTGNIVEYIDRQKILCAVVLEIKSQRLRLLSENARELTLAPQRLSHTSDMVLDPAMGREALTQSLKDTANKRNALISRVDIPSLWEVLNTEQQWIDLPTMTGLAFPESQDADHQSAVVRAFFQNRLYFKFSSDSFFPYTEEQARQAKIRFEKEESRKRLITTGVIWLKALLSGSSSPSPGAFTEDQQKIVEILQSYHLFGKNSESHAVAKKILFDAGVKETGDIFNLLVKIGGWDINQNLDLLLNDVPQRFSEEVLRRASQIGEMTPASDPLGTRRDLSDLPLLTIDGQSTLDFDDALSVEDRGDHYLLGIHISDVGEYVRRGDPLDLEALSRGSSIYMPDQKIPMISAELSENACSLIANHHRPAITTMVKITPGGKIIDFDIFPSRIMVHRQLSYSDANAMAESDPEISLLHTIGRLFRQKRLDEGAVHISLPEISIQVQEDGIPQISRIERESPSRLLVAEIMILANAMMADFLNSRRIPAVFRSQPAPRERLYQGESESLFKNWMQRKHLSRFVLGTKGQHHDGLGLSAYVTATSPIRKYYDLITQRQLRAALGLEDPYSEDEISSLLQKLDHPMKYVPRLQYSRNRYWLLKHLETRIGEKEEAIVLSKRREGYQILIPAYMIECILPHTGGMKLKPEDFIQVTFQHVNARKDDLKVFLV